MANHQRCSFDGDHPYLCPFISTVSNHRNAARGRPRRCVQVRIAGGGDFLAAEIAAAATRLAGKQG
jgi:hypothetical protein